MESKDFCIDVDALGVSMIKMHVDGHMVGQFIC